MKQRLFLLMLGAGLSFGAALFAADSRPNILFLFADDQRADTIAALGNPVIKTPNLDRLVQRGLAFNRAYMQGALQPATCVPSRAMLLSSRSVYRVDTSLLRDETWPAAFGKSGYRTFITGKWHNGSKSVAMCFQAGRAISNAGMGDPMRTPLSDLQDGKLTSPVIHTNRHACASFADAAIGFLNEHNSRPFFCYVPFDAPHDPHIVPADFPVHYDPQQIPLPPNFLAEHPWNNGEMTIRDEKLLPVPRQPEQIRAMLAEYYRYVSYLDSQIGRVLDALAASPHATNTIVVFSADSGVARGSHGLIGKQNLYEHSVRVPLIVAGPGIPAGQRTDALCYLLDVMPTLGSLCHVPGPETSEGMDLTPVLRNPRHAARSDMVFAYRSVQCAVATPDWKLISYPKVDKVQLFNLKNDPFEQHNLAADPEQSGRMRKLRALMNQQLSAASKSSAPTAATRDQAKSTH
ncbi:MAG: sulfatase-like hydrolase/transferase [Verrucomicrobiota bacterium]